MEFDTKTRQITTLDKKIFETAVDWTIRNMVGNLKELGEGAQKMVNVPVDEQGCVCNWDESKPKEIPLIQTCKM